MNIIICSLRNISQYVFINDLWSSKIASSYSNSLNSNASNTYLTDIIVDVTKGKNHLLDIVTKASQKDIYIEQVKTYEEVDHVTYIITIKTVDTDTLENYINDLKSSSYIINVERKNI